MNALIVCECSQVITSALRASGVNAFSLDVQLCRGTHPEWHICTDATPYLLGVASMFVTQSGDMYRVPDEWDLIIAHPPCTYLSDVQAPLIYYRGGGVKDHARWQLMRQAADFFRLCLASPAKFLAVENPKLSYQRTGLPRPNAVFDPRFFGNKYSKRTYLWTKNLPPFIYGATNPCPKSYVYSTRGSVVRSKTFPELAEAIVTQWLPIIKQETV